MAELFLITWLFSSSQIRAPTVCSFWGVKELTGQALPAARCRAGDAGAARPQGGGSSSRFSRWSHWGPGLVSHTTCLSASSGKRSVNLKGCGGERERCGLSLCWFLSLRHSIRLAVIYSARPPGTSKSLEFRATRIYADRTAAHLLEAPRGVLVRLAALKLACFSGKDTRPESKWSGIQPWLCDGLAMWPWANTFSLDLSFFSCKVIWLLGDCWSFFLLQFYDFSTGDYKNSYNVLNIHYWLDTGPTHLHGFNCLLLKQHFNEVRCCWITPSRLVVAYWWISKGRADTRTHIYQISESAH